MSVFIPLPTLIRIRHFFTIFAMFALPVAINAQSGREDAFNRAVAHFQGGRLVESVTEFDSVAKLMPSKAPYLWQRGIALYYVGRYSDCRQQFESHRTVNPNDVENAAWHFLCVARGESIEKARATLLPVGTDLRVPMREIYQMFQGVLSPDRVLDIGSNGGRSKFYAHLYVGLYLGVLNRKREALYHIKAAAADRYVRAGGYMHTVARVHLKIFQQGNS